MLLPFAPRLIILALLFTFLSLSTLSSSSPDLVAELLSLQSQSKSGVIHLNDQLVSTFLTSTKAPRPFSILIFFDAVQLHDKTELHLQQLKNEFYLLAQSYITNNKENPDAESKIFFCEIEFKESQHSFALFDVNSLPHIRLVEPHVKNLKDSVQMDQGDFSRMADSMADFVESKTKLVVGPIHRPPIISKKQLIFIVIVILIWTPYMLKKIISGDTLLHDRKIWLLGAIFVYFFSVSGAMHNIIRNMPMFLVDRNDPSKLIFFYQGSGMQLGAEGFAVGSLYTIVGLLLAMTTHLLVKARNVTVQRVVMILAMLVSFWAVRKVVYLDNWKTGYGVHAFFPSSWL